MSASIEVSAIYVDDEPAVVENKVSQHVLSPPPPPSSFDVLRSRVTRSVVVVTLPRSR
jgi:tryptophanyl-tRNA synthetase